jgi:hypothetical protein
MMSKLRSTIVNCWKPNIAHFFDLFGSFDANGTYYSMHHSIFHHIKDDLELLCADPYMIILRHPSNAYPVLICTSRHSLQDPSTSPSIVMVDHDRRVVINDAHIDDTVESRSFLVCDPHITLLGLVIEQNNNPKWRYGALSNMCQRQALSLFY